jgi:hypothetical protein
MLAKKLLCLQMEHMEYAQYPPASPFDMMLVTIHVLHHSAIFFTSPMTNDGLSVNKEQARGKQWWALQQLPFCELRTWSMINIDLIAILHTAGNYKCAFSRRFIFYITNDKE